MPIQRRRIVAGFPGEMGGAIKQWGEPEGKWWTNAIKGLERELAKPIEPEKLMSFVLGFGGGGMPVTKPVQKAMIAQMKTKLPNWFRRRIYFRELRPDVRPGVTPGGWIKYEVKGMHIPGLKRLTPLTPKAIKGAKGDVIVLSRHLTKPEMLRTKQHEFGHRIWLIMPKKLRDAWRGLHRTRSAWERENPVETFAENYGNYVRRKYIRAHLAPDIMKYFNKIMKPGG